MGYYNHKNINTNNIFNFTDLFCKKIIDSQDEKGLKLKTPHKILCKITFL